MTPEQFDEILRRFEAGESVFEIGHTTSPYMGHVGRQEFAEIESVLRAELARRQERIGILEHERTGVDYDDTH